MPNTATPARDLGYEVTHILRKQVTYLDDGVEVTVGVIPAGAIVIGGGAMVTTVFNAGTTNTLNVGTTADPNGFATLLALGTIGNIVLDELATSDDAYVTADTTISATVVLTGTAATTGEAFVYIEYIPA